MRINGRTLRPSTLAERRMLLAAGVTSIRVPRSMNPYAVARRLSRLAREPDELRRLTTTDRPPRPCPFPMPTPDLEPKPWPVVHV